MVGNEGLGGGPAGDGVHHRRFHFQVAVRGEELSHGLDDFGADDESAAGVLVGDQVEVALAVFLLLVGEAMEFLRQWPQRLGQQAHRGALDGEFVGFGAEQGAGHAKDVAQVHALEGAIGRLPERIAHDVNLYAPAHVLQGGETGLAHDSLQHHAAGKLHGDRVGFQVFLGGFAMRRVQVGGVVLTLKIVGEGLPQSADASELLAAFSDDLVFVLGGGGGFSHDLI